MQLRWIMSFAIMAPALITSLVSCLPAQARETNIQAISEVDHQERLYACREYPAFYEHARFRGQIFNLTESENLLSNGWNNRISSICVPEGWEVVVHKERDFGGRSLIFEEGTATTRVRDDLNNHITSITVNRVD